MRESEQPAFAVLTPPGRGGIAVIRCLGPGAEAAIAECFRPARPGPALPAPGALAYGHVVDADGQALDEVILCNASCRAAAGPPAAPAAGLTMIYEVNCHGGPAAVRAVCDRLSALGLAQVDADRLLELEGLPRLQREARRALRRATTPLAARILLDQLNGALARAIEDIARTLAPACGGSPDPPRAAAAGALAALDALLARWRGCGRFLADPPRIAIAGRPNSGKSTLLNRLVGAERAITSAAPGTTRDTVEAEAALDGVPVVLVDTAGLREAAGDIERAGVARARQELARAAVVVYLVDATAGLESEDEAALDALGDRALAAWNKIDAPSAATGSAAAGSGATRLGASQRPARCTLALSALTGEGAPALVAALLARLGWQAPGPGAAVPFTAEQAAAIESAQEALADGRAQEARATLAALLR
jgi:tRNA modification GTPase